MRRVSSTLISRTTKRSVEVLTLIGLFSVYYYSCFPLEVQEKNHRDDDMIT